MEKRGDIGYLNFFWKSLNFRHIFKTIPDRKYFSEASESSRKNHGLGFTLIEILVACAIIGVLAAILFVVLNPVEQYKKAHDAQRKHDLEQIRTALDEYYDDKGHYPLNQIEFDNNLPTYLSAKLLKDPLGMYYCYQSDNGNSYIIGTNLERSSDPQAIPNITCNSNSYNYAITSTNASLLPMLQLLPQMQLQFLL